MMTYGNVYNYLPFHSLDSKIIHITPSLLFPVGYRLFPLPIMEQVFKVAGPIIYLLTILQSQWNIPVNKSIRISYVGWGGFSAYRRIPVFSKNRFFGFAKP